MEYYRVRWLHNDPSSPEWIAAEVDGERWEVRKVEIFPDGSKGWAAGGEACGTTFLGIEPVPLLTEFARDQQFVVEMITAAEFESLWQRRTSPDR